MEKRACKRILINIDVKFSYSNYLYSGIAENVSEKGICFSTPNMLVPHGSLVELLIPLKEKFLSVHTRVNRLSLKTDPTINFILGADVLNPSNEYLNFVNSLDPTT
ncbi:MAG: PilZ domain-containing protein [Nitrospirae bacterium]|nr:PilZ domain-containing protein [Nitrospirota bacterium]